MSQKQPRLEYRMVKPEETNNSILCDAVVEMGHGVRITYKGLGLVLDSTTFFLGLLLKTTLKFTPRPVKAMITGISLYWIIV